MKKNLILIILLCVVGCFCFSYAWSMGAQQQEPVPKKEAVQEKSSINVISMIREEVHRFMGYEKLLPKYISMPYDISMNTNVRGTFIDIGFIILLILPLLLFLNIRTAWIKITYAVSLLIFYIISSVTGYGAFRKIPISNISESISKEIVNGNQLNIPFHFLKLKITQLSNFLYKPINTIFENISGEGDATTYPFVLFVYILLAFLLHRVLKPYGKTGISLVLVLFTYSFWGWILSAGVTWYSILILPLGILIATIGCTRGELLAMPKPSWGRNIFLGVTSIWVLLALIYRLADYRPENADFSKGAINGSTLMYGLGKANKLQAMNMVYPNYNIVLNRINSDKNAKVYRIATFFHYFIEDNHKRVFVDNQLGMFNALMTRVPDKKQLATALKKAGYRYLLVDLNVAAIDNTPEQSLTRKKEKLFDFLNYNPNIELITTDQVVLDNNGQSVYSIYGKEIQRPGTYAAFELK